MQISFVPAYSARVDTISKGTLVLGATEGGQLLPAAVRADRALDGLIVRAVAVAGFKGKSGQFVEILAPAGTKAARILLAGMGRPADVTALTAETLAAQALTKAGTAETQITFHVDAPPRAKLSGPQLATHLAMGAKLKSYRFDRYRTGAEVDKPKLERVSVATPALPGAQRAWGALAAVAEGVCLARDLVNEPPNVLYPEEFARRCGALRKLGVRVNVLTPAQMKTLGMNALLGVAMGSDYPPRMVVMHWVGPAKRNAKTPPIAFVGKGVCFDSGGLSLKPSNAMIGMKGDMAGAATVTGLIHALAKRKAHVNAVGVVGLVENMPDGRAQRPSDVVKAMSGKTIEVLNTDAEGRLVLADALWYTQSKFNPRFIVNLATLTGAIITALGHENAGLFSNDDTLSERLAAAGRAEGEGVWRLPLAEAYDKLLRSKIADVKNIGGPTAGSITAAQFLQRFVNKVPWAHLDIAGVAWQDGEQKPTAPSWGTGWGVRMLNRLVADHYER